MSSAKKQKSKAITSSFLGSEAENKELLSKVRMLQYAPIVEFYTNIANEMLVAVVRIGPDKSSNPVYRITDIKLVYILESFAEASGGKIYFYKVPY